MSSRGVEGLPGRSQGFHIYIPENTLTDKNRTSNNKTLTTKVPEKLKKDFEYIAQTCNIPKSTLLRIILEIVLPPLKNKLDSKYNGSSSSINIEELLHKICRKY